MGQRLTFLVLGCVLATALPASAQTLTISSNSGPAAKDFATEVLGDPWDMEEASDYVYTYSFNDGGGGPAFNAMPDVSNGVLHGISQGSTPKVCILHEGIPGAFNLVGRNGTRYPIDSNRFKRLSFRMKRALGQPNTQEQIGAMWMSQPGGSSGSGLKYGLIAATDTSGFRINQAPVGQAQDSNYHIYVIDLDQSSQLYQGSWSGAEGGIYLRLGNNGSLAGTEIDLDWVRLSERGTTKHLAWSGFSGKVTLTATNAATGDAIQIYNGTSNDFNSPGAIDWDYGFLPGGTWTITATSGGQSKSVTLTIDAAPVINITEPDATGGHDYATDTFADAWDLTNAQDLRFGSLHQIGNQNFTENGLEAVTAPQGSPDPFVQFNGQANTVTIPANRYHRFSFTLLYDHPELLGDVYLNPQWGGVCRVIWNQGADFRVTQDIVSLGGNPNTFVMDLATLSNTTTQIEDQGGHPGPAWGGQIQNFWIRIDEGTNPRWFRLSNVKLAADDEPNGNGFFTIKWRVFDSSGSRELGNSGGSDAKVNLYYDTDTDPGAGLTQFASNVAANAGQYSWDVSGLPAGTYYVYATITDNAGNTQSRYSTGPVTTPGYPAGLRTDSNKDGLPDAWEAQYGISDPNADEDGDGLTNAQEYALGTNPLIPNVLNLSEGATGFFTERIALANPDSAPADVTLTFLRGPGNAPINREYTLPPWGRSTVKVNDVAGLAGPTDVSTVITSNTGGVIAERTMMWGEGFYGGTTGKAIDKARTQWFLAEGVQNGFFDTFILLANATGSPANVTLRFLRDGAGPVDKAFVVPATSRITVVTARDVPEVVNYSFSTSVTSDQPITVERSTYFHYAGGRSFEGGTEDAAIPSLSTTWYLAEGQSSPMFSEFILLGNPNGRNASVTLKYLMPGGRTVTQVVPVAANSRRTIQVNNTDPNATDSPWNLGVQNTDVSVAITSDVPIAVERSMYWNGTNGWTDGHSSAGVTSQGTIWALAEGESGGALGFESYILFANPNPNSARVRLTFLRSGGNGPVTDDFDVPGNSRVTKSVGEYIGRGVLSPGEQVGVRVDSLNGVPIVIERAMYWNGGGEFWGAGTGETGFKLKD
jgi:hypothetical protein